MADQYYRFFPGDYQRDTGDLTLMEHGAYRVLLDHYYTRESLPSDKDRLYRICRAFSEDERNAVDVVVDRYFRISSGKLINKKADEEISERKAFIEAQSERGKRGAEARWGKAQEEAEEVAQAMQPPLPKHKHENSLPSPSPSPSPLPKPSKKSIGEKRKRFIPPTLDEVKNYCQERKNNVDPEKWMNHYTSNGWKVGKNKMVDWQAAVRTWEDGNVVGNNGNTPSPKLKKDPYYTCPKCGEKCGELHELRPGVKMCAKCFREANPVMPGEAKKIFSQITQRAGGCGC